ncbi:unnamed protein product [Durusdinium trenchii]|uniref:Uncharacterized protein n=1 Tax=Durusdinium trenchii TaxID=1381693 RepID=A0ABP0S5K4_9DINO
MDARDFVCYVGKSQESHGVKEFQIAVALMEGHKELLSKNVPSQWGEVQLFDVCLRLGLFDTACAMAQRGVGGGLDVHHLNRTFFEFDPRFPDNEHVELLHSQYSCTCCWDQRKTCDGCCFGFPIDHGIWMEDWAANCRDAAEEACQTAKHPLVWNLLEALHCGTALPFAISEEAMVHLMDIAILTGDKEAAMHCAEPIQSPAPATVELCELWA